MSKHIEEAVAWSVERLSAAKKNRGTAGNLLIGAGCSISCGIPSADGIIELIAKRYPSSYSNISDEDKKDYRKIINLIPTSERRDLIIDITSNKKLTWGYIALARIMEAGYISKVLNLNFDLQLQRACSLIGFHPAIYDFSNAGFKDFDLIANPSIVHLHGQSYGLVQMSDEQQTNAHMRRLRPLMTNAINTAPLAVIGYSGESDQLFKIMEKEFRGRESLTWLGYELSPKPHLDKLLSKPHTKFFGNVEFDSYMVNLARGLECWPPRILSEPLELISDWIGDIAAFRPSNDEEKINISYFVKKKIDYISRNWKNRHKDIPEFEYYMISLEFEKAIALYESSENRSKIERSKYHKELLSWAYSEMSYKLWNTVHHKQNNGKDSDNILNMALEYIDLALKFNSSYSNINNKLNIYIIKYLEDKKASSLEKAISYFKASRSRVETSKFLYNGIVAYIELYKISGNKEIIHETRNIWKKLREMDKTRPYNYICFCSISGNFQECKKLLSEGFETGTLPSISYMMQDDDLKPIVDKTWFKKMISKYEKVI
ncbi:hypothetical protein [Rhodobium gokarnense]|uniref:SIR2-like domain-containing protein n=1 Tax=Rhodobium gokarnense TaxID=364296 RepID=A0ABT3H9B1_9HYPH|nr:hypothetical protein [Rhodobium gokarnense]MCW2306985.1 hypothetical protein [Rhodobium gokarnense]